MYRTSCNLAQDSRLQVRKDCHGYASTEIWALTICGLRINISNYTPTTIIFPLRYCLRWKIRFDFQIFFLILWSLLSPQTHIATTTLYRQLTTSRLHTYTTTLYTHYHQQATQHYYTTPTSRLHTHTIPQTQTYMGYTVSNYRGVCELQTARREISYVVESIIT